MVSSGDAGFSRDDRPWLELLSSPSAAGQEMLSIRDMARTFGVSARALRLYESKGLLKPVRRGRRRLYDGHARVRLAMILQGKRLGFTLREIGLFGRDEADPGALSISRRECIEQINLLEARKREIEAALAELRRRYSAHYVRLAGS